MKTIHSYRNEQRAIDEAFARGGAQVTFPSKGKAIHFRQRCYTFRKLFLAQAARESVLGMPETPYDNLFLGQPEETPRGWSVRIEQRKFEGILEDLDGGEIALDEEDELAAQAAAFAKSLKGE